MRCQSVTLRAKWKFYANLFVDVASLLRLNASNLISGGRWKILTGSWVGIIAVFTYASVTKQWPTLFTTSSRQEAVAQKSRSVPLRKPVRKLELELVFDQKCLRPGISAHLQPKHFHQIRSTLVFRLMDITVHFLSACSTMWNGK